MGEKDITQKTLEGYNDVFADIINVLLFNGKEIIKEEELTDALPRSYYKVTGKVREQERDVLKYWNNSGIRISMIGIENEMIPKNDMAIRILGYDGAAYRDQIKQNENDRYPVVSVVLYFGKTRWDKAKALKDAVSVPEELSPYVNDYKINLFEISFLSDEQVNMFKSDFRYVADYFVQIRKNSSYIPPEGVIKHVKEVLELLRVMEEDENIADRFINNTEIGNIGGKIMGKSWVDNAIDELRRQGIERGKQQMIENALKNGSTPEEISKVIFIPVEDIKKIQETMLAKV